MIAELIMGGTVLVGVAYVYHLGSEHAKDMMAVNSAIRALSAERARMRQELEEKNEYIKELEVRLVATASPDTVASLLTGLFPGSEDSLLTGSVMPDLPTPDETEADLHSVGGLSTTND